MPGAMTRPSEVSRLTQASSAAGSALSEQTAVAARPMGAPSAPLAASTVTAPARWRMPARNASEEMPAAGARAGRERS